MTFVGRNDADDLVPGALARPDLLHLLDRIAAHRVAMISAPAGSGKTVLLRQWSRWVQQGIGYTPAWLSLTPDEDRFGFWTKFVDSLAHSRPDLGDAFSRLRTPPEPTAFAGFVNQIAHILTDADAPAIVIIDDLHHLRSEPALDALRLLVETAPESLHVVVACRQHPPLPVSRWRMSGLLADIGPADLALTLTETAELLAVYGVPVPARHAETVFRRTEGWVGGVRLASSALRSSTDIDEAMRRLVTDDHGITEYLLEQTVSELPASDQQFLFSTSTVDPLPVALANVLTDRDDAATRLRELERLLGFVHRVEESDNTYRYHALLHQVLLREAEARDPSQVRRLHLTAARWFANNDDHQSAIDHAERAYEWSYAAELLRDHYLGLWVRGHGERMRVLLDRLPFDFLTADPELAAVGAFARAAGVIDERIEELLAVAEARGPDLGDPARAARVALLCSVSRLGVARRTGDIAGMLQLAGRLPAPTLPSDKDYHATDGHLHALALSNHGSALVWAGRHAAARRLLHAGELTADRTLSWLPQQNCQSMLALVDALTGKLSTAQLLVTNLVDEAGRRGWTDLSQLGGTYLAGAIVAQERDQPDVAEHLIDRAEVSTRLVGHNPATYLIRLLRARQLINAGDQVAARPILSALRESANAAPQMTAAYEHLITRAADQAGISRSGARARRRLAAPADAETLLARARGDIDNGRPAAAAQLLRDTVIRQPVSTDTEIRLRLWGGVAAQQADRDVDAQQALTEAVALAEQEGYRLPFRELGRHGPALLTMQTTCTPAQKKLIQSLLAGYWPMSGEHQPRISPRQREVLTYLAGPYSLKDVARELHISPNTVKSHVRSIYELLGARDRNDAVRKAHAQGMVDADSVPWVDSDVR